jgi:hypothetical protein
MAIFTLAISPTKLLAFHFQPMRPLRMLVRIALVNKQWIFMPGLGASQF